MPGGGNKIEEMTKYVKVVLCSLLSISVWAQYDGKGEDEISRFRPGFMWFYTGIKPAKEKKARKYDRLIFDITYNDWVGDKDPFRNHWSSIGLNTNVMFDIPITKGNTVSLGIGVAHQLMHIRHDGRFVEDEVAGTTVWEAKGPADHFRKSVLGGNSFAMPVEFRFRKASWKQVKFHIGGRIGYQVNIHSKYVTGTWERREVLKDFGFPDQSQLLYAAHIRLGIRNWAIFANYYFNTVFSSRNSTRLNLVQAGLSISLY